MNHFKSLFCFIFVALVSVSVSSSAVHPIDDKDLEFFDFGNNFDDFMDPAQIEIPLSENETKVPKLRKRNQRSSYQNDLLLDRPLSVIVDEEFKRQTGNSIIGDKLRPPTSKQPQISPKIDHEATDNRVVCCYPS